MSGADQSPAPTPGSTPAQPFTGRLHCRQAAPGQLEVLSITASPLHLHSRSGKSKSALVWLS